MKKILFTCLVVFSMLQLCAQHPVSWTFSAKKKTDKTFEVRMTATIQSGWKIYSQSTPEGGPLPTGFGFGKNPLLNLEGPVKEEGRQLKKHEDVFDVDVIYYKDKVEFVQRVVLKKPVKTSLNGWVEFMACDNEQCLPPKKQTFTLSLN